MGNIARVPSRFFRGNGSSAVFVLAAGGAAFCAYFSMYAFRKPFAAATYEGQGAGPLELDFKVALVIAHLSGYALSKVIGVKIVSEAPARWRAPLILGLIAAAWLALVGFALAPGPWKFTMLFLNGLPLGMIWGLVFAYLEGRRTSEVLGAILCVSFIVASGTVKAVGAALILHGGIAEVWMPAATGAVFMPLLAVSVWVLSVLPAPDTADEVARTHRAPMHAGDRGRFLSAYGPGVGLLVLAYVLFTAFRDFRDNFAAEIWIALGRSGEAAMFAISEIPVTLVALAGTAAVVAVRDNLRALSIIHAIVIFGALLLGAAMVAQQAGLIGPTAFMVASGAGLYLAYVPFNAMLFDRLIAAARFPGTAGFLIYLADASGYAGSVALLVFKELGAPSLDWLDVLTGAAYGASGLGLVLTILSAGYFGTRLDRPPVPCPPVRCPPVPCPPVP